MILDLSDRTVLLVEDNPGDARLIAESLRDAGSRMHLVTVDTLAAALLVLADEKIDAVILDLGLPDSQGLDTFARLQVAAPDVATLILSGDSDNRTALSAVQEGAQDFLIKGHADGETLVRSIGYAIERKKAEAEIAESEEKFRYIFDRSVVGKSLTGMDGTFEPNAALCAMLGYSLEELAHGTTWRQFTYPDDAAEMQRHIDDMLAGTIRSARHERRFLRKDGTIVWADISSSLRRDKAGQPLYFMTSALDITERKNAEVALLESESRLRSALQASDAIGGLARVLVGAQMPIQEIASLILDHAVTLTESEHGYVSRIDRTSGANTMLATTAVRLNGPDALAAPVEGAYPYLWGISLNTGRPFLSNAPQEDMRAAGVSGDHMPLSSYLSVPVITPDGVVGQIAVANGRDGYADADVTIIERLASLYAVALVQSEEHEALHRSARDLQTAQSIARIGSFSVDIKEGTWSSSPTMDLIVGIDAGYRRDVDGWFALVHEDDRAALQQHVRVDVLTDHKPLDLEYRVRRASDGEIVWVHTLGAVEPAADGAPERLVGATQDVSHRHQAEDEILATNESLQHMIRDVAEVMGSIIETRDPYTQGHQLRVAEIAGSLAVEMGLAGDMLDCIEMASLLHDIGKLSVPAEILSKPGKLSDVEFSLIKEHSQRGHDILERIAFPWPIADIVLQHHERCDGSGYPQGLAADAILLPASIISVADVLEAMASFRPYRASLGADAAMAEITGHPEKYCPEVVAAAVSLHERGGLGI